MLNKQPLWPNFIRNVQKPLPIPVGVVMAAEVGSMAKPRAVILGGRHDSYNYN
jgi:hypothetical protein